MTDEEIPADRMADIAAYAATALEILEKSTGRSLDRDRAQRALTAFVACAAPEDSFDAESLGAFVAYILNLAENDFVELPVLAGLVAQLIAAPDEGFPHI